MHQESLSLWGEKIKKKRKKSQAPDVVGRGKNSRARRHTRGCAQGRSRRQRRSEMGLGACAGTCVWAQPPLVLGSQAVGGCRAGCPRHRRCQGTRTVPAACEGPKGVFSLGGRRWEALWHRLMSHPCFLRLACFPHFRHTHPLPKPAVVRCAMGHF